MPSRTEGIEGDPSHLHRSSEGVRIAFEMPLCGSEDARHVTRPEKPLITKISRRPDEREVFGDQIVVVKTDIPEERPDKLISVLTFGAGRPPVFNKYSIIE